MTRALLPVVALAALGLSATPAAPAAAQQPQQQRPAPPAASSFDSDQLQSYAAAVVEVQKINEEYLPKLESAESRGEQQKIREEATGMMVEAIKAEGISVETYNKIYKAARADPRFAQRLNRLIEEAK